MATALVASASCLIVLYAVVLPRFEQAHSREGFLDRLQMDPATRTRVGAIDAQFETEREKVIVEFEAAKRQLADLLVSESTLNPEIARTIEHLHHLHGTLQSLSIRRYFAILDELPDEQRPLLRKLAAESLSNPE